ncbi:MAG TPA: beta/gamma crystallin family protein [Burkholderiales bacterium]|nr:beta/gamma crystallin family protein [Burkholderiales bacterium]
MKRILSAVVLGLGVTATGVAVAEVTLYQDDNFQGRSFTATRDVANFDRRRFNDRASSAKVRGGRYEVCTDAYYSGRCVVLRPGNYPSLRQLGLQDNISSVRAVSRANRNTDRGEGVYERQREERRDQRR